MDRAIPIRLQPQRAPTRFLCALVQNLAHEGAGVIGNVSGRARGACGCLGGVRCARAPQRDGLDRAHPDLGGHRDPLNRQGPLEDRRRDRGPCVLPTAGQLPAEGGRQGFRLPRQAGWAQRPLRGPLDRTGRQDRPQTRRDGQPARRGRCIVRVGRYPAHQGIDVLTPDRQEATRPGRGSSSTRLPRSRPSRGPRRVGNGRFSSRTAGIPHARPNVGRTIGGQGGFLARASTLGPGAPLELGGGGGQDQGGQTVDRGLNAAHLRQAPATHVPACDRPFEGAEAPRRQRKRLGGAGGLALSRVIVTRRFGAM